jgi:hypothetical protein
MCHERKILELTLWLSKHLVIMFEKEIFKNTKPLLKAECFALEAPVRPTQSTSLTGDNGLTVVSNLSPRAGSINDTSLTVIPDRSDRSPGKKTFAVFGEKK